MYDPMGLITPVSIRAKVVAQSCWSLGIQWDPLVPEDIKTGWVTAVKDLVEALKIQHTRFIGMSLDDNISLHLFADGCGGLFGWIRFNVYVC